MSPDMPDFRYAPSRQLHPPRAIENRAQTQAAYATKVSEIAGDELEVVVNRRRGDLKIRVRQHPLGRFQLRLKSPVHPRNLDIVRENRQSGQHACLDVAQVSRSVGRTTRPLEQFADHDCARELFGTGDGTEPPNVPRQWAAAQHLRDRARVEEKGHSVQRDTATRARAAQFRQCSDQVFGALPAADETRQARSVTGVLPPSI
jgi:hypothetical protein